MSSGTVEEPSRKRPRLDDATPEETVHWQMTVPLPDTVPAWCEEHFKLAEMAHVTVEKHASAFIPVQEFIAPLTNCSFEVNTGGQAHIRETQEMPDTPKLTLTTGAGLHQVKFREREFWVLYDVEGPPVGQALGANIGKYRKIVVLTKRTEDAREGLLGFMKAAMQAYHRVNKSMTKVFVGHGGGWRLLVARPMRPLSSVVVPDRTRAEVVDMLTDFFEDATREWYREHGIPYHRSVLLYGPPGSGKTSLVLGLAGHFGRNACLLHLTTEGMDDTSLAMLLQGAPAKSFIILEDIDALFTNHREKQQRGGGLTFSGLINALDGLSTPDEVVFFMTTNHIDRLDAAILRDGRVDLKVELTYATVGQLEASFRLFYPDAPDALVSQFASQAEGDRRIPMSSVQNFFIRHRRSTAEAAVADAGEMHNSAQDFQASMTT